MLLLSQTRPNYSSASIQSSGEPPLADALNFPDGHKLSLTDEPHLLHLGGKTRRRRFRSALKMLSPDQSHLQTAATMPKHNSLLRTKTSSFFSSCFLYAAGTSASFLLAWAFWSFFSSPAPSANPSFSRGLASEAAPSCPAGKAGHNRGYAPPDPRPEEPRVGKESRSRGSPDP